MSNADVFIRYRLHADGFNRDSYGLLYFKLLKMCLNAANRPIHWLLVFFFILNSVWVQAQSNPANVDPNLDGRNPESGNPSGENRPSHFLSVSRVIAMEGAQIQSLPQPIEWQPTGSDNQTVKPVTTVLTVADRSFFEFVLSYPSDTFVELAWLYRSSAPFFIALSTSEADIALERVPASSDGQWQTHRFKTTIPKGRQNLRVAIFQPQAQQTKSTIEWGAAQVTPSVECQQKQMCLRRYGNTAANCSNQGHCLCDTAQQGQTFCAWQTVTMDDWDKDGITNINDQCLITEPNAWVNRAGCSLNVAQFGTTKDWYSLKYDDNPAQLHKRETTPSLRRRWLSQSIWNHWLERPVLWNNQLPNNICEKSGFIVGFEPLFDPSTVDAITLKVGLVAAPKKANSQGANSIDTQSWLQPLWGANQFNKGNKLEPWLADITINNLQHHRVNDGYQVFVPLSALQPLPLQQSALQPVSSAEKNQAAPCHRFVASVIAISEDSLQKIHLKFEDDGLQDTRSSMALRMNNWAWLPVESSVEELPFFVQSLISENEENNQVSTDFSVNKPSGDDIVFDPKGLSYSTGAKWQSPYGEQLLQQIKVFASRNLAFQQPELVQHPLWKNTQWFVDNDGDIYLQVAIEDTKADKSKPIIQGLLLHWRKKQKRWDYYLLPGWRVVFEQFVGHNIAMYDYPPTLWIVNQGDLGSAQQNQSLSLQSYQLSLLVLEKRTDGTLKINDALPLSNLASELDHSVFLSNPILSVGDQIFTIYKEQLGNTQYSEASAIQVRRFDRRFNVLSTPFVLARSKQEQEGHRIYPSLSANIAGELQAVFKVPFKTSTQSPSTSNQLVVRLAKEKNKHDAWFPPDAIPLPSSNSMVTTAQLIADQKHHRLLVGVGHSVGNDLNKKGHWGSQRYWEIYRPFCSPNCDDVNQRLWRQQTLSTVDKLPWWVNNSSNVVDNPSIKAPPTNKDNGLYNRTREQIWHWRIQPTTQNIWLWQKESWPKKQLAHLAPWPIWYALPTGMNLPLSTAVDNQQWYRQQLWVSSDTSGEQSDSPVPSSVAKKDSSTATHLRRWQRVNEGSLHKGQSCGEVSPLCLDSSTQ